jgi:hypothetical protein
MTEPCSRCDDNQRSRDVLEAKVSSLREERDELDTRNTELLSEVAELQSNLDEHEEFVDNAYEVRDAAFAALRDEKGKELAMLRRLEFCLHGLCPLCKGVLEHKVGCDLKLAIFRVDHELACRTFEASLDESL